MKIKLLITILILFISNALSYENTDTLYISLKDCLRLANQQGISAKIAKQSFASKFHRYKAYFAEFLPQLSLSGNIPNYDMSISSNVLDDGKTTYYQRKEAFSSLNLSLDQSIPLTGTFIGISSSLNRLDNIEDQSYFYRSTPLAIRIRQPLLSINNLAWSTEQENLNYKLAKRKYLEDLEDVYIEAIDKFFNFYLAYMNIFNANLKVGINDTLFNIAKGRYNVGRITENDLLQSELALLNAQTEKEDAELAYQSAEKNLLFILNLPLTTKLIALVEDSIPNVKIDKNTALQYAKQNRSETIMHDLQKLNAERNVRKTKSDNSLSMELNVNVGLNQTAKNLKNVYRDMSEQQQLSLTFKMPIFGFGSGSHAIESAIAEQEQVENNINKQKFDLEQNTIFQLRRFDLLLQQVGNSTKAEMVANRRFEVAKNHFLIGKIDVTNLFLAQTEKDYSYRARVRTLWDFWSTYHRIRKITLYDFLNNQSLIDNED